MSSVSKTIKHAAPYYGEFKTDGNRDPDGIWSRDPRRVMVKYSEGEVSMSNFKRPGRQVPEGENRATPHWGGGGENLHRIRTFQESFRDRPMEPRMMPTEEANTDA